VHESPADLAALQDLLDSSYASAGAHLLSIHTPERRLSAGEAAQRLTGMCLLAVGGVPGLGPGVCADRRRPDVRLRDAAGLVKAALRTVTVGVISRLSSSP
jgi:hypothetical protein